MRNEQPQKPLALRLEEAGNTIFNAVNMAANEVPFYLIDGILVNILHQVREQAKAEKDKAAQLYEKQLAEYIEAEKKAESEDEECKKQ